MTDFSQSGEQAVILKALGGDAFVATDKHGRFLDIGAYHPTCFSNTRALFEAGWSGVMIEAAPGPMRALLEAYGNEPGIELVQAAAALEPGFLTLQITDDAVSTSDKAVYEEWKDAAKYLGALTVPTITPEQIFNRWGGFDMISIDIEGQSVDVFLECLRLKVFPKCFCVEIDAGRLPEMMTKAGENGYLAKVVGANLILWQ